MKFYKYHGNGNDFVIVDGISESIKLQQKDVRDLCDRRFGIGADGLMILVRDDTCDFEMIYYNSDGNISSMCGNGGRCIAAFAYQMGIAREQMTFRAFDGLHKANIIKSEPLSGRWVVDLQLSDVEDIEKNTNYYFLDTGSPHYVEFTDNVAEIDVFKEGNKTRYSEKFSPEGTNVNFVEKGQNRIFVRTYERGVEDETLSCGTGVTASALAYFMENSKSEVDVHTTGGDFIVRFKHQRVKEKDRFSDIWLTAPAMFVYSGEIKIQE